MTCSFRTLTYLATWHSDYRQRLTFEQKKERIRSALAMADLSGFEKRDIATLSGGQKARVSLLRTLLAEPEAILLDEPFSKLDKQLRQNVREFVFQPDHKTCDPGAACHS